MNFYKPIGHAFLWGALALTTAMASVRSYTSDYVFPLTAAFGTDARHLTISSLNVGRNTPFGYGPGYIPPFNYNQMLGQSPNQNTRYNILDSAITPVNYYTIHVASVAGSSSTNTVVDVSGPFPLQQYATWQDVLNASLPDISNLTEAITQNGQIDAYPFPSGIPTYTGAGLSQLIAYKDSTNHQVINYLMNEGKVIIYSYTPIFTLPYTPTYASLPGAYTSTQNSVSNTPITNVNLTPDTNAASNTYYFIDSTNKKYYADQYVNYTSGTPAYYKLTVSAPTLIETYNATQALALDLLPYDFRTGGLPSPYTDCTASGLYTLGTNLFIFPNDFPVESTIPPTKNPTGKGQIYPYYSQNGANQNEITVYQYFVDGASDPAKDKGVNVQLYSYTMDPPAYLSTYAPLPGNYTATPPSFGTTNELSSVLQADTDTASNNYYFIDPTNNKYYLNKYVVSGGNYTLTVTPTSPLKAYDATQALTQTLLPYDLPTNTGSYYTKSYTFPADFPTDKGQIYSYYSQSGANQNEITVYQYFVDGSPTGTSDQGSRVQLYSYTMDPPAYLSTYAPLPGNYTATPPSFGTTNELSSVLQADTDTASNNYYFIDPTNNKYYLNKYVVSGGNYTLTVTPTSPLKAYKVQQALALDPLPSPLPSGFPTSNGTYYTKAYTPLASEISTATKGTIKDYYSQSGGEMTVHRYFIDGSPTGTNNQGSRIQIYSYTIPSILNKEASAINCTVINPDDGDIRTLRTNVLSFKINSQFNNRPTPTLKWEVTGLSWKDGTAIYNEEMDYSLCSRQDGSCRLTLSPNYIRFNDPDYNPQTGETDFKVTMRVTDLDVANWLSSKGLIGSPDYSQTFNLTLKASPIDVSFNEKRVNVFPSWKDSRVREYVKAQFKSLLSYPKQNPPSQGYLDWNFALGSNLASNLSILFGPQLDSWNHISKTFMAEKTLILKPKSAEADDTLTVEVTHRDPQNNVVRFGKETNRLYLGGVD